MHSGIIQVNALPTPTVVRTSLRDAYIHPEEVPSRAVRDEAPVGRRCVPMGGLVPGIMLSFTESITSPMGAANCCTSMNPVDLKMLLRAISFSRFTAAVGDNPRDDATPPFSDSVPMAPLSIRWGGTKPTRRPSTMVGDPDRPRRCMSGMRIGMEVPCKKQTNMGFMHEMSAFEDVLGRKAFV